MEQGKIKRAIVNFEKLKDLDCVSSLEIKNDVVIEGMKFFNDRVVKVKYKISYCGAMDCGILEVEREETT